MFRPTTGRHRIVDVDRARDVTAEFTDADGDCNLLDQLGLDSQGARRLMRFGAADLAASSHRGQAVEVLAALDQRRVWAAADALRRAEGDLTSEAEAIGSAPEDAAMIEEVEARHIAVERGRRPVRARPAGAPSASAAPAPALTIPGGERGRGRRVPVRRHRPRRRGRLAPGPRQRRPGGPRRGAGARGRRRPSYLGFQLQRVNGLLANDANRKALMDVAGARRAALADWQQLAGDIPVEWALANREEIEEAARLRREVDALGALSSTAPEVSEDVTGDLAHVLVTRLAEVRAAGGEGVPLVLDDPFRELDPSVKPLLLELLGRSAGEPQIVFLTEDEDVASWARLEALTGEVALIEPAPEHDEVRLTRRGHPHLTRRPPGPGPC